jgi:gluconolactonase
MTKLYVGETSATTTYGGGDSSWASPALWVYDLDENTMPVNKQFFGMARATGVDGMHIDDAGRVWTGEGEGIVIRNPAGKVIGIVNAEALLSPDRKPVVPLANFALAGDKLIILALTRLYVVQLAQTITTPGAFAGGSS